MPSSEQLRPRQHHDEENLNSMGSQNLQEKYEKSKNQVISANFDTFMGENKQPPLMHQIVSPRDQLGINSTSNEKGSNDESMYDTNGISRRSLINLQNYGDGCYSNSNSERTHTYNSHSQFTENTSISPEFTRRAGKVPNLNLDSLGPQKGGRPEIYIKDSDFKVPPESENYDSSNNKVIKPLFKYEIQKSEQSLAKTKESSATNRFQQFARDLLEDEPSESTQQSYQLKRDTERSSPNPNQISEYQKSSSRPLSSPREQINQVLLNPNLSPSNFETFKQPKLMSLKLGSLEDSQEKSTERVLPFPDSSNPISNLLRMSSSNRDKKLKSSDNPSPNRGSIDFSKDSDSSLGLRDRVKRLGGSIQKTDRRNDKKLTTFVKDMGKKLNFSMVEQKFKIGSQMDNSNTLKL